MGTWGTGVKDNDAFADVYSDFFDEYNKGGEPVKISEDIIKKNWKILEIEEERNSLWFAVGLAQWETRSLNVEILKKIEDIISSGDELNVWRNLGAAENDIKKRKVVIEKFLEKLKSDRPKAKPRRKNKLKTPVFATGDCLVFKMQNGNYGGAVILATDNNHETAYNLVATTRLDQVTKPSINDFKRSEILVCNFANWQDRVDVSWYTPDLYFKEYADIYEVIGNVAIGIEYDIKNYLGSGYLFKPFFTSGWNMNQMIERQLKSENDKPKPLKTVTLKQLIKKSKTWKFW